MSRGAALLAVALVAGAPFGGVRAPDDPACARFEDPLAYNACLASHGPKAGAVAKSYEQEERQGIAGQSVRTGSRADNRHRMPTRAMFRTQRNGRVHMEFRVQ